MKFKDIFMLPFFSKRPSWKAGGIPYWIDIKDPNKIWVCLVVSTDPTFGGADPAIPKGEADFNEKPLECAIREVEEETGIEDFQSPMLLKSQRVAGLYESYTFHVFAMQCRSKSVLKKSVEGIPKWYLLEDALNCIRATHRPFLKELAILLKKQP